jgi:hypothetical protein
VNVSQPQVHHQQVNLMRSTGFVSAAIIALALLSSTAAHAQNSFRAEGREDRRDFREQQRFEEQRQREERFRFEQSRYKRIDDRFEHQRFDTHRDQRFDDRKFDDRQADFHR